MSPYLVGDGLAELEAFGRDARATHLVLEEGMVLEATRERKERKERKGKSGWVWVWVGGGRCWVLVVYTAPGTC